MIFNCGLTSEETWKREKARLESWHSFFTLWPRVVSVDEEGNQLCAWLQAIQRKGRWHDPSPVAMIYGHGGWWEWEFRQCDIGESR